MVDNVQMPTSMNVLSMIGLSASELQWYVAVVSRPRLTTIAWIIDLWGNPVKLWPITRLPDVTTSFFHEGPHAPFALVLLLGVTPYTHVSAELHRDLAMFCDVRLALKTF